MKRTARYVAACAVFTAAPYAAMGDILVDAGPGSVSQTFTTGNTSPGRSSRCRCRRRSGRWDGWMRRGTG